MSTPTNAPKKRAAAPETTARKSAARSEDLESAVQRLERANRAGQDLLKDLERRQAELEAELDARKHAQDLANASLLQRAEAEKKLHDSEAALAEAQSLAHVGSWQFDRLTNRLTWSDETCRIFGVDPKTFVPSYDALVERTHPDDRALLEQGYAQSVVGHTEVALDHRIVLDDGSIKVVHERGRTHYDAAGRPIRSIGVVQDITERKALEQELQFANALFAAQLEGSPDGILVVGQDNNKIALFNRRFGELWHIPQDVVAAGSDNVVLKAATEQLKDPQAFADRVAHLYAHPDEVGHEEIEFRDGRVFDRYTSSLYDVNKKSLGRIWFFSDITARKKAEIALRQERDFSAALLESLPGFFTLIDDDGRMVRSNNNLRELTGLSDEQLNGREATSLVVEADRETARSHLQLALGGGLADAEFGIVAPGGEARVVRWSGRQLIREGRPYVLAVGIDMTQTRQAEQHLRASEERFRTIFGAVYDAIIVVDADTGAFIDVNPRVCEMFGYTREQMLGLDWGDLSAIASPLEIAQAPQLRGDFNEAAVFEWLCKASDGHKFWLEVSLRQTRLGGRNILLATARDVTERRTAEAALIYRDRVRHAVSLSAAELVTGSSLAQSMPRALQIAGEALQVDRLLVLERAISSRDAAPLAPTFAWQKPGVIPISSLHLSSAPADLQDIASWHAPLSEGKAVTTYAESATGAVARIMREMNNLSTLLVPISIAGKLWGLIGVDDCTTSRRWTPVEIDTLATLAQVIGSTIVRERTLVSLQESEERFRAVSDTAQDAIIMLDAAGKILYWNHAAERILGYSENEAIGQNVHDWLAPTRFRRTGDARLRQFAATGFGSELGKTVELAAVRKDGVEIPVELSIAGMRLGGAWNAVAILRDLSERYTALEQIKRMARHDVLTGLANRAVFVESVQFAIARALRGERGFAVLYLDLDHFKDVNDTLGHPVGDLLLQTVSQRLLEAVRETDTVARFGGDEFAIIAAEINEPSDAATLAEKVLKAMGAPASIQGNDIRIGTSIGIAVYGLDAPDAESLMSRADVALYGAKLDGRGTYRFFTDAMDTAVRTRVTLGNELREAIVGDQLFLMYQPQVDVHTGRIVGVEALVRWRHPTRGVMPPNDFIPVAETSGLIVALGHWVLHEACRQMKAWLDAGIDVPLIAVNVSGLQFKSPREFEKDLAAILAETAVPPARLELEITESVLMKTSRDHNDLLLRLRKRGLRIAIDDFGTGYSSLEYLARFKVDRIKIAQTFMLDLSAKPGNAAIVKAAIGLARDLALDLVVEGVETAEQLAQVKSWGAREIQGYCYAKPLIAEEAARLLRLGKISPSC